MKEYVFCPLISHQEKKEETAYRKVTDKYISEASFMKKNILVIQPEALETLAKEVYEDISFYLRTSHLKKVAAILDDPEASDNDRFVALTLLKNQVISARGELPGCQDTGTPIIMGFKGQQVWTGSNDADYLSRGVFKTFRERNLRYSQMAPLSMFEEKNTGCNLPAQVDIQAVEGEEYHFLFLAKGGGSANKSFLLQQTKSLLNENSLAKFITEQINSLGTAACPPYHIAIVIGGTSAEFTLKAVKMASTGYYDDLPTTGNEHGRGFRDLEWEERILSIAQNSGIGAQFGGKYLAHDVRVIRLPRHAASCPVGIGVSCSADRNIKGKITREGVFLEQLEMNPERFLPDESKITLAPPVSINLDRPMDEVLKELSTYPIKTRLSLSGTLIVARDIAHAKIREMLEAGQPMPDYFKKHPVYYAGPAKTPKGKPSGSFGPTTAGRMDGYVDQFMSQGGSMIMLAKGNRSDAVTRACGKHGGFYLGSIGGPAAILAEESIKKVEIVDFEEQGMEAVRKIEVENFPAFIICDDKGNNFFDDVKGGK